ncbi:uncharacterized protein LOC123558742 [Mercenaria mercenaria]|uniref:uncharacterized protein LOC123558742 n=1 Tax=Mercenaria mercenaria TaxID=6596 RepID=UPI00234F2070|nr:uncharacterized protein LOC123558742 [Mercenaria mercenaria]
MNSDGFGNDTTEVPSELTTVGNGATGGEDETCRRPSSTETLALLECEYKALMQEEEELQKQAQISKLKKKISNKRRAVADLRVSRINQLRNPKIKKCLIISDSIAKHVKDI